MCLKNQSKQKLSVNDDICLDVCENNEFRIKGTYEFSRKRSLLTHQSNTKMPSKVSQWLSSDIREQSLEALNWKDYNLISFFVLLWKKTLWRQKCNYRTFWLKPVHSLETLQCKWTEVKKCTTFLRMVGFFKIFFCMKDYARLYAVMSTRP